MKALVVGAAVCVLGATGVAVSAGRAIERVTIRIDHSRFAPGTIEVQEGQKVEFTIVNADPIDHEFIVGDESVQEAHELGDEKHHGSIPTEISVPAGSTRATVIEFTSGSDLVVADPLLFGCHLPRHYDYGMRGVIQVD